MGPSHHARLSDSIAVSGHGRYETPLGRLDNDVPFVEDLLGRKNTPFVRMGREVDVGEHSLEMQYPFLWHLFEGRIPVVSMHVGHFGDKRREDTAISMLAESVQDTLFVISSDFCHWGRRFGFLSYYRSRPATINSGIEELDMEGIGCILRLDADSFEEYLERTGNTICGQHAILFYLKMLEPGGRNIRAKLLKYSQSSIVSSEDDSCVCYAAVAFYPAGQ